jgi:hypothetical protein
MKKLILTLVLVVLTTTGFTQKLIKSITVNVDTLQSMTWSKSLNFRTAKDRDMITYTQLLKTDYNITIDLVSKTVTFYYNPEKKVCYVQKIVNFKTTPTSYFVEYFVDGYTINQKLLICENEDKTYSAITQYASNKTYTLSMGDFDRNVKVVVK